MDSAGGGVVRSLEAGAPLRWSKPSIVLYVPPEPGLDHERLLSLVDAAASSWRSPCIGIEVIVRGAIRPLKVQQDGISVVVFQTGRWCPESSGRRSDCFNNAVDGRTEVYSRSLGPGQEREVAEADIRINLADRDLTSDAILATLTHEIGHVLGLDHPCMRADISGDQPKCRPDSRDIMHPDPARETSMVLTPSAQELDALCTLYPRSGMLSFEFASLALALAVVTIVLGAHHLKSRRETRR